MKTHDTFSTQIISTGAAPALVLDAAELRVTKGPDKGARVELGEQLLTIGSGDTCQLVLHDKTVSSRHAAVSVGRRGYVIEDLASKNGVYVGGWPVERAPLADGMRIKLGDTVLTVRSLGKRHEVPLVEPGSVGPLTARSLKMRAMAARLLRFAASDIAVLIQGETGAGKEVCARALHELGPRRDGPFVVADCAAIPASLINAELFGVVRGAFTGANADRAGLFEEADGGTLFLDEVGELPLEVQPVLLRALETHFVRRIGGKSDVGCDVRVVAATNRNCDEAVRNGLLRSDLYYRLAVGTLTVPPLREREEDIPELARVFAAEHDVTLSPELTRLLLSHHWPGNVRELRNVVARAAAMPGISPFGDETLERPPAPAAAASHDDAETNPRGGAADHRGAATSAPLPMGQARQCARDDFERAYLERVLAFTGGNMSKAAEVAGVSRSQLMRLAARHNMLARDRKKRR